MTPSKQVFTLLLSAALFFPLGTQAQQNPQPQTPVPQAPALTDEQVRAWLLQSLQSKQVLPATPIPAPSPTPALPTAEQLAQFEKWMQLQEQQVAVPAPPAQTAAQAFAQYQSCIASEKERLTNAANGQQTPASVQNQINNTSAGLSKKTGGLFDLNELLRQMRAAGIEAKATKNCKALAPPAAAPKQ